MSDAAETVVRAGGDSDEPRQQAPGAPYMSYRSFRKYLEDFELLGLPAQFDSSYFASASGSTVAQLRGTLRFFDLIDDDRRPTPLLAALLDASEDDQKIALKDAFESHYEKANALDRNATRGQLADVFREQGLSGDTVQKAIGFYLSMADDVGIELSPYFKRARSSTASGPRKRRASKAKGTAQVSAQSGGTSSRIEEQRAEYVKMLMDLATRSDGQASPDLLDRIEHALGLGPNTASELTQVLPGRESGAQGPGPTHPGSRAG